MSPFLYHGHGVTFVSTGAPDSRRQLQGRNGHTTSKIPAIRPICKPHRHARGLKPTSRFSNSLTRSLTAFSRNTYKLQKWMVLSSLSKVFSLFPSSWIYFKTYLQVLQVCCGVKWYLFINSFWCTQFKQRLRCKLDFILLFKVCGYIFSSCKQVLNTR